MDKINKLSLPATILIGSIILGGFYYASEANKQSSIERQQQVKAVQEQVNNNNFSYQEKCAGDSTKFFDKYIQGSARSISDGYVSHYNQSLNKCFIELSSGVGTSNDIIYELADAVEGTEYGEIEWTPPNENKPGWCTLYPSGNGVSSDFKSCNSKIEFDNFAKPYMKN